MGLNASKAKGGAPRTPPLEEGLYPARLVQVIDLGLQPRSFKGEDKEPQQQIMLTYELCGEFLLDEDGQPQPDKPRWVSETMGLNKPNVEKAKSTKALKALDPANKVEGDFTKLLGAPVMVNIAQNPSKTDPSKIYAKVTGLAPMRAKDVINLPDLVNSPRMLDLDSPDKAVFDELPDWVKTKIREGLEYKGSDAEKVFGAGGKAEAKAKPAAKEEEADGNPY
jgi:hypothetical protein